MDDEALARDELAFLLGQAGGVDVVGTADNGIAAVDAIDRLRPDVVFLDIQMPGLTGFESRGGLSTTRRRRTSSS